MKSNAGTKWWNRSMPVSSHSNIWSDKIHVWHQLNVSHTEWMHCGRYAGNWNRLFSSIDHSWFIIIFPVMELRSRISFASKGKTHRSRDTGTSIPEHQNVFSTEQNKKTKKKCCTGEFLPAQQKWSRVKKHYSVIQYVFLLRMLLYHSLCAVIFARAVTRNVVCVCVRSSDAKIGRWEIIIDRSMRFHCVRPCCWRRAHLVLARQTPHIVVKWIWCDWI